MLHQLVLPGSADSAGRTPWVNAVLAGNSEIDVARMFLTSAEYQAAHSSDAAFVTGLYTDVLGRSPSAAEVAGWQQALRSGMSRAMVAQAFLTSREADLRLRNAFYMTYLPPAAAPPRAPTAR